MVVDDPADDSVMETTDAAEVASPAIAIGSPRTPGRVEA